MSDGSKKYPPNRIAEFRAAARLTKVELAKAVGMDVGHLAHIENQAKPYLGSKYMQPLADFFRVKPHVLMSDPVERPGRSEIVEDPDELALLDWWRSLDDAQRRLVTPMVQPPSRRGR